MDSFLQTEARPLRSCVEDCLDLCPKENSEAQGCFRPSHTLQFKPQQAPLYQPPQMRGGILELEEITAVGTGPGRRPRHAAACRRRECLAADTLERESQLNKKHREVWTPHFFQGLLFPFTFDVSSENPEATHDTSMQPGA